jgi:hypothetical protein
MNKFIKHLTPLLLITFSSLIASNKEDAQPTKASSSYSWVSPYIKEKGDGDQQLDQDDLEEVTIDLDERQNTPPATKGKKVSSGWAAMLKRSQKKYDNKKEIDQKAQKQNIDLKAKFFKYKYHLGIGVLCIVFVIFVIKKIKQFFTRKKKVAKKLTLVNSAWRTFEKIKKTVLKGL